ncbi:MAG: DHHA1 domain-containing protein [Oscillospiraceae bacterium]
MQSAKITKTQFLRISTKKIKENPAVLDKRVIVFSGVDWHHGVVGIVAARCMEKFGRPVFLMSRNRGDTEVRGSARSFGGFSIFKALSFAADTLTKFGGHSGAGGFSLTEENIPLFDEKLQEFAHGLACDGVSFSPAVTVCGAVTPGELTAENIEGLNVLEPFGEANPRPVFLISDCVISDIIPPYRRSAHQAHAHRREHKICGAYVRHKNC